MRHPEFIAQVNELITKSLADAKKDYNDVSMLSQKLSVQDKAKEKLHADVALLKRKYVLVESIDEKESDRLQGILDSMIFRYNTDILYMEY